MLGTHVFSIMQRNGREQFIFQQDNALIYVSYSTMRWFRAYQVEVLDLSACSLDVNPKQNVWRIVVFFQIYAIGKQYDTVNELKMQFSQTDII